MNFSLPFLKDPDERKEVHGEGIKWRSNEFPPIQEFPEETPL
jgi:hypothetical protein